jgi:hypothetical protein
MSASDHSDCMRVTLELQNCPRLYRHPGWKFPSAPPYSCSQTLLVNNSQISLIDSTTYDLLSCQHDHDGPAVCRHGHVVNCCHALSVPPLLTLLPCYTPLLPVNAELW